jgi:hypothetical protein
LSKMGLKELRYAAKVDLTTPAAEQKYLHVRLFSASHIPIVLLVIFVVY